MSSRFLLRGPCRRCWRRRGRWNLICADNSGMPWPIVVALAVESGLPDRTAHNRIPLVLPECTYWPMCAVMLVVMID